jgi:hypothetical protein
MYVRAMKTFLLSIIACIGCRTEFTGSPHTDPATCQSKCQAANLQFAGMVYMGEYSSACICDIARPNAPPVARGAGAGAGGAAAGVVMQMRAQQEQQQRR